MSIWIGSPWEELIAGALGIFGLECHGKFDEPANQHSATSTNTTTTAATTTATTTATTEKPQHHGSGGIDAKQPTSYLSQEEDSGEIITTAIGLHRRINKLLITFTALYNILAVLTLAYLLLSYGEEYFKTQRDTFNVRTDIPLFVTGVVFFLWKSAAILRYKPSARLDNRIYKSPIALLCQWGFCLALSANVELVTDVTVRRFLDWFAGDGRPWFIRHLDPASWSGLLAKVGFWTFFWTFGLSVAMGANLMMGAAYFLRLFSGAYCTVYAYDFVRPYFLACKRGRAKRKAVLSATV